MRVANRGPDCPKRGEWPQGRKLAHQAAIWAAEFNPMFVVVVEAIERRPATVVTGGVNWENVAAAVVAMAGADPMKVAKPVHYINAVAKSFRDGQPIDDHVERVLKRLNARIAVSPSKAPSESVMPDPSYPVAGEF